MGRAKAASGANLEHDELPDDLQFAGGELPDRLHRPWHAADHRGDNDRKRDQQYDLHHRMLDPAGRLPDALRTQFAFALKAFGGEFRRRGQVSSAIDALIDSSDFSAAARPTAIAAAAR